MTRIKINNFLNRTFISNLINNNSIVLDLGACKGEFSNFIKKTYGSKIFAIEANPEIYEKLKNLPNIKTFNYCVTDSNKFSEIKISSEVGSTSNKINKIEGRIVTVQGITLKKFLTDQDIEKIDLLKMNIEGAEIEILNSVSGEVLKKVNQIAVSFHDFLWPELRPKVKKIKKKLRSAGFYCITFSMATNGDVLFVKRELLSVFDYMYLKYFKKYIMGIKRKLEKYGYFRK